MPGGWKIKKSAAGLLIAILLYFFVPGLAYGCIEYISCPVLRVTNPVDSGPHIAELQELLKTAGYYAGASDGQYNFATARGVKIFQRDHHLTEDGVVGQKTWDALAALYEEPVMTKSNQKRCPKGKVSILIDVNRLRLDILDDGQLFKSYPIATGKRKTPSPVGEYKVVHKAINWGTGFGTRWLGLNVPWGIYGIHGTNKPGSIGSAASHGCFRMLNRHVEEIFPWVPVGTRVRIVGYTPKFSGFNRHLKLKKSGQDVAMLQYRLQEIGFSVDNADGRYGGVTEFNVKLFEAYHMLPVDGEADLEMLQRLERYQNK